MSIPILSSTYDRAHEQFDATFMNIVHEPFTKKVPKTVNANTHYFLMSLHEFRGTWNSNVDSKLKNIY